MQWLKKGDGWEWEIMGKRKKKEERKKSLRHYISICFVVIKCGRNLFTSFLFNSSHGLHIPISLSIFVVENFIKTIHYESWQLGLLFLSLSLSTKHKEERERKKKGNFEWSILRCCLRMMLKYCSLHYLFFFFFWNSFWECYLTVGLIKLKNMAWESYE